MNNEITDLQMQFELLSDELRESRSRIQKLEKQRWARPVLLIFGGSLILAALNFAPWHAGAAARSLSEVPNKVTAPFEVVDDQGRTIFRVIDQTPNGQFDRGAYVLNESGGRIVDLTSTSDGGGGGRIKVTAGGSETTSELGQATGVTIDGNRQSSGMQIVRQGKKVASIGAEGEKSPVKGSTTLAEGGGMIQVYNSSEKPALTLSSGKNGGELDVYDTKNKQAATVGSETGGGSIKVYASTDKPKAILGAESDGGSLKIYGSADSAVATLQSEKGDGSLTIGDQSGHTVATVAAQDNGGVIKAMLDGDANTSTVMGSTQKGLGLSVKHAGALVSYVGWNDEKTGAVFVYGSGSAPAAMLSTDHGKGVVGVLNNSIPIAFLSESGKFPGGGELTVADPGGNGVFAAGYSGDGGEACLNRKGSLKCLGVGLPLQINE